ncbi:MAG: hypothetical protein ACK4TP_19425, partial [Hyphomicrobium sp.]
MPVPVALGQGSAEARIEVAQAAGAAAAIEKRSPPSESEATYMSRMDKIVAPLLDYELSADDLAKLNEAIKA